MTPLLAEVAAPAPWLAPAFEDPQVVLHARVVAAARRLGVRANITVIHPDRLHVHLYEAADRFTRAPAQAAGVLARLLGVTVQRTVKPSEFDVVTDAGTLVIFTGPPAVTP